MAYSAHADPEREKRILVAKLMVAEAPNVASVWRKSAWLLFDERSFPEGLDAIDRAVALEPRNPDNLMAKGEMLFRLSRYDEAVTTYDALLDIMPNHADAAARRDQAADWSRYSEAVDPYLYLAQQGFEAPQLLLGGLFGKGLVVPRDLVQSHFWLSLATRAPSRDEDFYLIYPEENREFIREQDERKAEEIRVAAAEARYFILPEMTPGQIAEAERLFREWTPRGE